MCGVVTSARVDVAIPTVTVAISIDARPALGTVFKVVGLAVSIASVGDGDVTTFERVGRSGDGVGLGAATAAFHDGDIVDVKDELVGDVEVTDGDVTRLTGISAKVDSEMIPSALVTVAAGTFITRALGRQRPLLEDGESGGIGVVGRRNSHAEVFGSIAGILAAGPEVDAAAEGHLRRYEVVVGSEHFTTAFIKISIGARAHQIVGCVMTRASQRGTTNEIDATDGRAKHPGIAVAIGVDGGPALGGAVFEVIDDAFATAAAAAGANEGDIVDTEEVARRVHTAVFFVGPSECMGASAHFVAHEFPTLVSAIVEHKLTVDVESALVPIIGVAAAFAPATSKEADGAVLHEVHSGFHA